MEDNKFFINKKVNIQKLNQYGFIMENNRYIYSVEILGKQFLLTVAIFDNGVVGTVITDNTLGEEYTLHRNNEAVGAFVGMVREEYEKVMEDISQKCFVSDIFKCSQTQEIISYVADKYGDELEFLWPKTPNNAIYRRMDNKKWYAVLLTLCKNKLGLKSNETVEILDLRIAKDDVEDTIDNKRYFPGWHMNKRSWYTIILDGTVETKEICKRIDQSYILAKKK